MVITIDGGFGIQVHGICSMEKPNSDTYTQVQAYVCDNSLRGRCLVTKQANNEMRNSCLHVLPELGHSEGVKSRPFPQTPGAGFGNDTAGLGFGRVAHPGGPWPPPGCSGGG